MNTPTAAELVGKKCAPCEGGVPPLSSEEAADLLGSVPGWSLTADGKRVRRSWVARNFMSAVDFLNRIAALAEEEGHHPDFHLTGYRDVSVEISTHAIGGLSENDFILAAKVNELPITVKKAANAPG